MLSQTIERAITNRSNEMIPKIKQKRIKSDNFTRGNRANVSIAILKKDQNINLYF